MLSTYRWVAVSTWPHHLPFPHFMPRTPIADAPDHWLNVMLGFGAAATILAFIGGTYVALRYGRRASVSVAAEAHLLEDGNVIISCRPTVRSIGIRRVKFNAGNGSEIRVTELQRDPETQAIVDNPGYWEQHGIFGSAVAEPAEELPTTVVFPVGVPSASVVGWRVTLWIRTNQPKLDPAKTWVWADRVFVPRPDR